MKALYDPGRKSCQDLGRILTRSWQFPITGSWHVSVQDPREDPAKNFRIVILYDHVKIFYDPKHIMYITGSLRESCKILTNGFNKEFLLGCVTENPVHHHVCFDLV